MYKKTKKFDLISLYLSKLLWNYNKKEKCDNIIKEWHIIFKSSNLKERNFLQLLNNNLLEIKLSYIKEGLYLKHFGFSNLLCTHATQAITNHTLIKEYCLRFFPREEFKCPYRLYPIELRHHILYEYRQFNKYWNPMRETINYFISFLEFNPNAFLFGDSIT